MNRTIKTLFVCISMGLGVSSSARETYNFNAQWSIGKLPPVTLPRAWNEKEAYAVSSYELSDSIVWYRKHFRLPKMHQGDRVLIEFEGVKHAAEVYLNHQRVGISENGIMAFGFDLTPYLKSGDNLIEVKTDNHTDYKELATGSSYQWTYAGFYANYGGITKNVKLHIVPAVYQTLPLYSQLKTTGTYIYGSDYDIPGHNATINVETQVTNSTSSSVNRHVQVIIEDLNGRCITSFSGEQATIAPGGTSVLHASRRVFGLHFWSWGYGYLYRVKTIVDTDTVTTTTGFRKAEFKNGMVYLNDRVMMVHGYAHRSTNEWPCVGVCAPAWMSDYSNRQMVDGGGNVVRWMHVTPSKQEIESCDRVGLIQAMPAGDSEKDAKGRWWEQRMEVMRDAIIYNRNNPSILFYESGNNQISEDHMAQMKQLRDNYDPHGMRAIGSRNMLNSKIAEYGGEMLYINKSDDKPMWMMEYCRDEGLRKYWNSWSYPFHKEGDGPLYRGKEAPAYNHNSDELAVEFVRRWYEYWQERPGQATRVNAGGVKITYSDAQSHSRGEANYRTSGVVDPMRIEKDGYWASQVMWTGWVDDEKPQLYIMGHWNYQPGQILPKVYVVSNDGDVKLYLNGQALDLKPENQYKYLYTFTNVPWKAGVLEARSAHSSYTMKTSGAPHHLKLTPIMNPSGWQADGADIAMIQVEVVDSAGQRCPLANDTISYTLRGNAEYLGGIAQGRTDNWARMTTFPVDAGVNRVMLRAGCRAGQITLIAKFKQLGTSQVSLSTLPVVVTDGLSKQFTNDRLPSNLSRGETPSTPSFRQSKHGIQIVKAESFNDSCHVEYSYDGNETTVFTTDGILEHSWIRYILAEDKPIEEICLKMGGFRKFAYPIEVYADTTLVWKGVTSRCLGYVRLALPSKQLHAKSYTIRMYAPAQEGDLFEQVKEIDARNDDQVIKGRNNLRIIEAEFLAKVD